MTTATGGEKRSFVTNSTNTSSNFTKETAHSSTYEVIMTSTRERIPEFRTLDDKELELVL